MVVNMADMWSQWSGSWCLGVLREASTRWSGKRRLLDVRERPMLMKASTIRDPWCEP